MRKKITIFIIVVILIITAVVFFSIYKSKKGAPANNPANTVATVNKEKTEADSNLAGGIAEQKEPEFKGAVVGIGEIQIVMKNADGVQGFYINEKTPVFVADGKTKSELWNIKPGLQADVFYDEATKSANKIILLAK